MLYDDVFRPRINCPHLAPGLVPLEALYPSLGAMDNVTIPSHTRVLLRQCALPAGGAVLNRIRVGYNASLVFDDSDIDLRVREIYVDVFGSVLMGDEKCRLYSRITVTFYGAKADSALTDDPNGRTSKGLISNGLVEVHGKRYHPTWTRLARTAFPASSIIYLQVCACFSSFCVFHTPISGFLLREAVAHFCSFVLLLCRTM